jgi:hypothetical protein
MFTQLQVHLPNLYVMMSKFASDHLHPWRPSREQLADLVLTKSELAGGCGADLRNFISCNPANQQGNRIQDQVEMHQFGVQGLFCWSDCDSGEIEAELSSSSSGVPLPEPQQTQQLSVNKLVLSNIDREQVTEPSRF